MPFLSRSATISPSGPGRVNCCSDIQGRISKTALVMWQCFKTGSFVFTTLLLRTRFVSRRYVTEIFHFFLSFFFLYDMINGFLLLEIPPVFICNHETRMRSVGRERKTDNILFVFCNVFFEASPTCRSSEALVMRRWSNGRRK